MPSSAVAAIAASTSAKLASVTPVMPRSAKSAAVKAGDGVPPAAVTLIASTIRARFWSSAKVSTPEELPESTTAFSRSASALVLITANPRAWN